MSWIPLVVGIVIMAVGASSASVALIVVGILLCAWGVLALARISGAAGSGTDAPSATADALSRGVTRAGSKFWQVEGTRTTIGGVPVDVGLHYVGAGLTALFARGPEPALLNPFLEVRATAPDRAGRYLDRPLAYDRIPPSSRGAYLRWIEGGRQDPAVADGYLRLFLSGLERRALIDARDDPAAMGNLPAIVRELERLAVTYRARDAFLVQVQQLHGAIAALHPDRVRGPEPRLATDGIPPRWLRAAIGRAAHRGEPIEPHLLMDWLRTTDRVGRIPPAPSRARDPVRDAVLRRLDIAWPNGYRLPADAATLPRLGPLEYSAISIGLGPLVLDGSDLPDVGGAVGLLDPFVDFTAEVAKELGPRAHVPPEPERVRPPAAGATTSAPPISPPAPAPVRFARLADHLGDGDMAVISAAKLYSALGLRVAAGATPAAAILARAVADAEAAGYGVEPDPRAQGLMRVRKPVIFRIPAGPRTPPAEYGEALPFIELAAQVALADGRVEAGEWAQLDAVIERTELPPSGHARLHARIRWIEAERPDLRHLSGRVALLDAERRAAIAETLVALAGAGGQITGASMTTLARSFTTLGLPEADLYRAVHAMQTTQKPVARTPAPATPATPVRGPGPAPARPVAAAPITPPSGTVTLDMDRVRATLASSERAVLALGHAEETVEEIAQVMTGLDDPHRALLLSLGERPSWSREEYRALAQEHGLMADAARDRINNHAIEIAGYSVLDGDTTIDVEQGLVKELTS